MAKTEDIERVRSRVDSIFREIEWVAGQVQRADKKAGDLFWEGFIGVQESLVRLDDVLEKRSMRGQAVPEEVDRG